MPLEGRPAAARGETPLAENFLGAKPLELHFLGAIAPRTICPGNCLKELLLSGSTTENVLRKGHYPG